MQSPPPYPPQYPPPYRPETRQVQPAQPPRLARPGRVIDEGTARTLSALAHGALAFGFLGVGFLLSLAITGVIWLYGRRSPQVRFHSEQAGCYQCSVLLINLVLVVGLGAAGGLSLFDIAHGRPDGGLGGLVLLGLVLFLLWFAASILYGLFAALMVLVGKEFKYPIIGARLTRKT
ncbi:MAG: DUF4870 domain-containing protein [Chloroflexia bacterium]|jgi:uncharacterized Tic20 family protein